MPWSAFHFHSNAYKAIARLLTIPAFSIASHSSAETLVNMCDGHFLEMLRLLRCVPIVRSGRVSTKGTNSPFMDFAKPVFYMDFKLEHTLFGVALPVKMSVIIGLKWHRYLMSPFKTP